ncbi:MAG: argininosuccinate lyase [Chloroflexi bacterium]|nr:argininosuccinate lyase [Chloroflexota bacterium]MCI0824186.1 argininosuccinate lyase [Chloroflexota bacterium]MCI0877253.1 argininosuccinate lyase [Chloroflexota bacterium]
MADFNDYTVSIHYDRRLFRQDIAGSIAHARMLARQEIISKEDADLICQGLEQVREEIQADNFPWDPGLEDLHMNIESRLHQLIGPVAGRLHTGRSRNDQIALDMRLYTKEVISETVKAMHGVQQALVDLADKYSGVVMPGYTHLQRAQPVLFAHHMLSYFQMLQRDKGRLRDGYRRADVLPLGSGALAGVAYPTDREFLARELGFSEISANSMDAVSDRDFVLEYLASASFCMMHLSRLAEEIVLWSSREFGFIQLSEDFTTGSSIMPQKRNPDFAELARGKTGRVYGNLMGLLTVLKGLPLTYNRDLQEDKEGLFDTVDTLLATLGVFQGMLSGLTLDVDRVTTLAGDSLMLATDLADYLVGKGVPFREAHGTVRDLCTYCQDQGKDLQGLTLEEYQRFSPHFDGEVYNITPGSSAAARDNPGGTAPSRVAEGLRWAKETLEAESDGL